MSASLSASSATAVPSPARGGGGGGEVRGLLPDFCSLPMTVGVVLYGELLAILLSLATPSPLAGFWLRLGPLSLLVLVIALSSATLLCLMRRGAVGRALRRVDGRVSVVLALLFIVGSALGTSFAATQLMPWVESGGLLPEDGPRGLVIRSGLISAIVGALLLRYLYLHGQWRAQVEAVANARFQTLQARIRPHFLFNSMNTIASLTQTDPRLAEEVVEDLADLFRASLATDVSSVSLAEELELTRRYLNIEAQRLGERMRLSWRVGELPGDAQVPPLILQPLVENAVYHGIQPSTRPGRIEVDGDYRRGMVHLRIRNSMPEPDGGPARTHKGNGMALENVTQRMEAMFPGKARVSHSRVDGDFLVRLSFPYPWRH